MKGKKKIIIIGAIATILLIGLIVGGIVLFGPKEEKELKNPTPTNTETPTAPAQSTENLVETMEKAETVAISKDTIEFAENAKVEEGELIAVWVYSKPKFLGYFKVVVSEGKKVIEGLEAALAKLDIEPGEHNIALVKEDGEELGYIDVKIEKEGIKPETFVEETEEPKEEEETEEKTTTKTIKVNETINFSTTKQNEVNMKKGTTKVVTAGVKGTKEVTYEVTYNADGKEISRKKVSEKTTKQPVNEVIKVGQSEFNLNTDKETGSAIGFMCTENEKLTNPDGGIGCDDSKGLKSFSSISINDIEFLVAVDNTPVTPVRLTNVSGMTSRGTYQGTLYYFDVRGGGGGEEPLTQETCNRYKLSCGTW